MNDEFYVRFEDRFRGSREVVKDRIKVYLPIIEPLLKIYPDIPAIDLGCGRGEWIELLQENGWLVKGIDTNLSMVKICQSHGLPALQTDAIEYLRSLNDISVSVVSGFHIAAHLTPELLLLDEVLSVGDAGFQEKSKQKMKELINSGATIVFVSHTKMRSKIFAGGHYF